MDHEKTLMECDACLQKAWAKTGSVPEDVEEMNSIWITLLPILLDVITGVLQNCQRRRVLFSRRPASEEEICESCRKPGLFGRMMVRRAVARELRERYGWGSWRNHDGDRLTETVLRAGEEADTRQIQRMLALPDLE